MGGAGHCGFHVCALHGDLVATHTGKSWPLRAAASPHSCSAPPAPGPRPHSTPHPSPCATCLSCPTPPSSPPQAIPPMSLPTSPPPFSTQAPRAQRRTWLQASCPGEVPEELPAASESAGAGGLLLDSLEGVALSQALELLECPLHNAPLSWLGLCEKCLRASGYVFVCVFLCLCVPCKGVDVASAGTA